MRRCAGLCRGWSGIGCWRGILMLWLGLFGAGGWMGGEGRTYWFGPDRFPPKRRKDAAWMGHPKFWRVST